jgi:hypothetical protein
MFADSLSTKKKRAQLQASFRVRDKSVSGGGDCEDTVEWARVGNGSKDGEVEEGKEKRVGGGAGGVKEEVRGGVGEEEVEAFHVTHSG